RLRAPLQRPLLRRLGPPQLCAGPRLPYDLRGAEERHVSEIALLDLLMTRQGDERDRIYGVVVGVVTNNQDPDKLGRVKVKFPWLSADHESGWARIACPMAGNGRGFFFLPEVDDEVLIAFEHGRVEFPYVVGSLYNGKDKPPGDNGDGKNNLRSLKSRSGH